MLSRKVLINAFKFLGYLSVGKKRPIVASLNLTNNCNLRCRMCDVWRRKDRSEISTEKWEEIINKISDHVVQISFTGGEPTLRKDLPKLIDYVYDIGLFAGMATNGTLLHKVLPKCEGKLFFLSVSLDNATRSSYLKQRGVDLFDRVVKNVRMAKDLNFVVTINCVITRYNFKEISSMKFFEFAKELGVDNLAFSVIERITGEYEFLSLDREETADAMDAILTYIRNDNDPPVSVPPSYYKSVKKYGMPRYDTCRMFSTLAVDPLGEFMHCCKLKFKFSNKTFSLLEESVPAIYEKMNWRNCNDCVYHSTFVNSRLMKILPDLNDAIYLIKTWRKNVGSQRMLGATRSY